MLQDGTDGSAMAEVVEEQFSDHDTLAETLDGIDFARLAPAGHYVAIRLGFTYPIAELNHMPQAWVEQYARQGLMLDDPVVRWAYGHAGARRWSEIGGGDPRQVMALARSHGLAYGAVVACAGGEDGDVQRSFGSFARADREFSDGELAMLLRKLVKLHRDLAPPSNLTQAELEVLRMVKQGMKLREIAGRIGVTEGAIKQRLKNARGKLGARNGSHAVSLAAGAGLI